MDSVLDFLDNGAKRAAFEHYLSRLEAGTRLDLDALRICLQLLPPLSPEEVTADQTPHWSLLLQEKIWDLLFSYIPEENPTHLYEMAQICFSNSSLAAAQIDERIYSILSGLLAELSSGRKKVVSDETELLLQEKRIRSAEGYLNFLKCSFWLPKEQYHPLRPNCIGLLSGFIGIDGLDHAAQDTLSALFSLLKNGGPIAIASPKDESWSWTKYEPALGRLVLNETIVDQSFWNEVKMLGPEFFTSNTSHVFRTWFQWISQVVTDDVDLECLRDDLYWSRLQSGLLKGFADQRKYCLGIIRQSLLAARGDVLTPTLEFHFVDRTAYLNAYEQYSVLFETIVLDRYQNQVQACLPNLEILLGPQSKISSTMATTLLAAALNSKVQEGIRKIIGIWYMNYVIRVSELRVHISTHVPDFSIASTGPQSVPVQYATW